MVSTPPDQLPATVPYAEVRKADGQGCVMQELNYEHEPAITVQDVFLHAIPGRFDVDFFMRLDEKPVE